MTDEKHNHLLVTWGGSPHNHGTRERPRLCDLMHGYCLDPFCSHVLVPGDNHSQDDRGGRR